MKIGIDTDGVLTDMSDYLIKTGIKRLKREPINPNAYSIEEMFDASKWEVIKHGLPIFVDYCKNCPPRADTSKVIQKLNDKGHELFEITARKFVMMKNPIGAYSRKILLEWYKNNALKFKKVVFCSEKNTAVEKTKACTELGVKVMVEDRPEIAEYLANNGITVLLFDAPYNQGLSGETIHRVYGWNDVYKFIREYQE